MASIMIVDDNVQNLYLLETLLKNNGHDVISAKNGAEALDLAREAVPDLIITDILMPVMDGFELCRIWKADEQLKHVPFIFYTATYTDAKDEQLALSLGAERFIIKPQQPEALVQIVTEILDEFNKGEIIPMEKPLGEEMEVMRDYNAVLFHKLEKKVMELEHEIIERKKIEDDSKKILAMTKIQSDLLAKSSQPFAVRFLDGRLSLYNEAFCELIGYTKEELIDFDAIQLTPPEWLEQEKSILHNLEITGEPVRYEKEYIRKDGSRVPIELLVHLIRDDTGQPEKYFAFITDVSERKRMAEVLRDRDIRLEKLASQAPGMLFQFMRRPDGTYCVPFTTEAITKIFGCSPQDVMEDFSPIANVILPEDVDKVLRSIDYSAEHLTLWQCEYRVQVPGQPIRWMWGSSMPEKLADGSIVWHGYNVDIDERKQTEEALRETKDRLETLISNAPIGIATSNSSFIFETANDSFCTILGYSEDELQQMSFKDVTHPEDLNDSKTKMEDLIAGAVPSFSQEKRYVKKDGTVIIGRVSVSVIRDLDGNPRTFVAELEDITERKKAEEENRFKSILLDTAMDSVFVYDEGGTFQYVNEAAYKDRGFSRDELFGMNLRDLLVPEYAELMEQRFEYLKANGEARLESAHFRKDGTIMPVDVRTKIVDFQGQNLFLSLCRDITERKQSEEEIRFRSELLDSAIDSIFVHDKDGNFYYMNEAAYRSRGYTKEEMMAKNLHDLDAPEFNVLIEPRMEDIKSTKGAMFESAQICKDGTIMPVEVHAGITNIQGYEMFFSVVRDITERKKADAQLKITQERIEALARFPLENPNPVLRVSTDGSILYANPGSEVILESWEYLEGEKVPQFVQKEIDSSWASNSPNKIEFTSFDRVYSFELVPIPEHGYVNLYGRDITDLKNTQQALIRLNAELEEKVAERTASLEEVQERMMRQEKLATIGKLAGNIAHELRNPLGVITNSIYYLGMRMPVIDEKIQTHLKLIEDESARASKIISDLLDFARIRPDEATPVNLGEVIMESLDRVQKPSNIEVELNEAENSRQILVDPLRMQQVFQNIISNAYQAMPGGGKLTISVQEQGEMIEIAFTDTGEGIPEANMPKIFEPLFSTKIHGIGLGLPISKEIVEEYGGSILVESTVGVGTTFRVQLPF
jgi:PAS domain S-box-containing protein